MMCDVRHDIELSRQRAHQAGLDPAAVFAALVPHEIDPAGSLLVGASPVLDELEESLRGSAFATLLVDRECRVVRRWCDDPRIEESFEAINVRRGACLLEDTIGTNAIGTALVTRQGVSVHGSEHFAEALQGFSCYGHPIRHPLTKRIEGVLDISAIAPQASPLLPALIQRTVRDIEQRLLDGSRSSEKSLLAAFQGAAGLRRRAIIAVGEDIVLSNQAASDLLSPSDVALLRVLAEEPLHREDQALELTLESGRPVSIEITRVSGARRGALLRIDPFSGDRARAVVDRSRTQLEEVGAPTLVHGAPGTGRTSRARELADRGPVVFLRPAAALLEGDAAWARELGAAMRRTTGSVVVDGIDLLSDELLDLLIEGVEAPRRPHLVLTSGPVGSLTGRAAVLAAMATMREELAPLAARRKDVPELAASLLRALGADPSVHLCPSAVQALTAQPWPGNLRELKAVLAHAAARRTAGAITLDDLPAPYRLVGAGAGMPALDQAERDVMVMALRTAGGNKVRAAQELGVSRTTLYARMRALRITSW